MTTVLHKTFSDFVLFLYIHMAAADGTLHPREEELILTKMAKLYPGEASLKEKFEKAVAEYRTVSPFDVHLIIRESFKHFAHVKFALKYHVYYDMFDILHADGKVEESETKLLNELKEIIDLAH